MPVPREVRPLICGLALAALAACGTTPGADADAGGDVRDDASTDAPLDSDSDSDTTASSDDRGSGRPPDVSTPPPPRDTSAPSDAEVDPAAPDALEDVARPDASQPDAAPPDTAPPDVTPPPPALVEACDRACIDRSENELGPCPVEYLHDGECDEVCIEDGVGIADEPLALMLDCIAKDPLCFQDLYRCVRGARFPDPVEHRVTVRGSGFGDQNGRAAFVAAQEETDAEWVRASAIITGGGFEVELRPTISVWGSALTLVFVDLDGDGLCTSADAAWSFNAFETIRTFDVPSYLYTLGPRTPPSSTDFVCQYF